MRRATQYWVPGSGAQPRLRLIADEWGAEDAPLVLLAHGGGQTRHAWRNAGEALARRGWRALALDLRGHGDSDWSVDGKYAIADFAGDIAALLDQLAPQPAYIGASLGGLAGLHVAATLRPHAFSAITLVDIVPQMDKSGARAIRRFMANTSDGFDTLEDAASAVSLYLPHREAPPSLEGLRKNLRQDANGRYRWHWDPALLAGSEGAAFEEFDAWADTLSAIDIPVHLVRGMQSEVVPADAAEAFLQQFPGARRTDIPRAAHMVAGDRNDAFVEAVAAFLDEIRAADAA